MKDEFLEHNMVIFIQKGITIDFYSKYIIDEFKFCYYKLFWLLKIISQDPPHGLLLSIIINNHYYYQL